MPISVAHRRFFRLAAVVLGYILLVIVWGAYVRASGSGAGCGSHWPLCNGEVLPQSESIKTWIEFSHRASSGLSLIAVVWMAVRAFRLFPKGHFVRKAAAYSVVAIFLEALIGAGLVLLKLVEHDQSIDRAISISLHLVNTSFLVAALTLTALGAVIPKIRVFFADPGHRRKQYAFFAGFLLLGAMGALTALGDTLFKPNSLSDGLRGDWNQTGDSHFLERLRIFHPIIAVTWGFFAILWLQELKGVSESAQRWARVGMALIGLNLALGLVNVLLLAPVPIQLVHLLLANLIWISLIVTSTMAASEK